MLMLLYYYFFNTPPPTGRPFARNWANRINSPHRRNGRTDGRDETCHVQIYTQGLWRQIRAAFTINQRNIVPSLPVTGVRSVYIHMYYNIMSTCVFGESFFFVGLYDWFCFSAIQWLYDVTKKRVYTCYVTYCESDIYRVVYWWMLHYV